MKKITDKHYGFIGLAGWLVLVLVLSYDPINRYGGKHTMVNHGSKQWYLFKVFMKKITDKHYVFVGLAGGLVIGILLMFGSAAPQPMQAQEESEIASYIRDLEAQVASGEIVSFRVSTGSGFIFNEGPGNPDQDEHEFTHEAGMYCQTTTHRETRRGQTKKCVLYNAITSIEVDIE